MSQYYVVNDKLGGSFSTTSVTHDRYAEHEKLRSSVEILNVIQTISPMVENLG